MFRQLLKLGIFITSSQVYAQDVSDTNILSDSNTLDTIVFTAFKIPMQERQTPFKVTVITPQVIRSNTSVNNAYLLKDAGDLFVQQSQLGGGSPVIRGFEASRILLVVDGVRMNNAIYRTGHLQNAITIDKNVIHDITVIHGANSTLYGTDALGGIIDIRTEDPMHTRPKNKPIGIHLGTQYNTAFNSLNNSLKLNYGNQKFAGVTTVSYNKIGDLVQGSRYKHSATEVWKRKEYVERLDGKDVVRTNHKYNKQVYSAYNQLDLLQKLVWKPNSTTIHTLNLQYSTSSDIPRYDRLTDRRSGRLRWAEWYYGPQKRLLGIYKVEKTLSKGFDKLSVNLNYQNIEESRFQRLFEHDNRQSRIEKMNILGYSIDLSKKILHKSTLQVGTDAQLNFLNSTAFNYNITNGSRTYDLDTRYPDGNNHMHNFGVYGQFFSADKTNKIRWHSGLRINYTTLYSQFINTSILSLPFNEARQSNLTYSGNIGSVYSLTKQHLINASISTAFRVPNIDDLAKVFESAGGVQLVVPNQNLKPEQVVNFELGYKYLSGKKIKLSVNGFYTLFRNAIVLDKFHLNGQDSVLYNGEKTLVVANQNKAQAFVYGISNNIELRPLKHLTLSGSITYTYGRYSHLDSLIPLDHIPPVYGAVGITYNWKIFGFITNIRYNGAKKIKDYNPYGEDNLQYATTNGVPAWYTWNIYVSRTFGQVIDIVAGVENITDNNYRLFASGISAPGRNFIIKLNLKY